MINCPGDCENRFAMDINFRILILVLLLSPFSVINAQIDYISAGYQVDDLASFRVTFTAYYHEYGGAPVEFAMDDTLRYRFEWNFGDGNTGNWPVMLHTYPATGVYNVTLTVTDRDDPLREFNSGVLPVNIEETFEVPNVFTPDGDGINDNFIVRSDGVTPLTITIFDRAGNIVYKHTSPVISWDGRNPSGIRVSPGVYYYVITSSVDSYNKTGFVHVFYNR